MASEQIIFLVILAAALLLLITEWVRIDLTAVLIVVALAATGILEPSAALSGFSSDPAILLVSMFVLSAGLNHTGVADRLGAWIGRLAGQSIPRAILVMMPSVALMAAFSHHLMITALMLPVILALNRDRHLPASRLMMPMALAASIGTSITVIAAPAFLVARDLLERNGDYEIGVFAITPIGIVLTILSTLFVLAFGRWLLPSHEGAGNDQDRFRLERYYTELVVLEGSSHVGKSMQEFREAHASRFVVVDWLRHDHSRPRPWRRKHLAASDLLLVLASPDELTSLDPKEGLALHAVVQYGQDIPAAAPSGVKGEERLVQAVVSPDSSLIGGTIGRVDFLARYGVVAVGLWRKRGLLRRELSKVRLRAGDLLVLWGNRKALDRLANNPSFLLLLPFAARERVRRRAWLAASIMLVSVVVAATELLPVPIAFLAGAAVMVGSGCLSVARAYASVEVKIFVFIAGAIPLGIAMEQTGVAALFAGGIASAFAAWDGFWVLLALFFSAALLTQILSDAATTVLLGPVALSVAVLLELSLPAAVFSVAMGAVVSPLTPVGHHGNLLVYEPGSYRFSDFLRLGIPLTLLLALAVAWLAPLLWPA